MNIDRIKKISELIEKQGRVSLDELIERFKSVSSMTLRRDLLELERAGEIIRVRGGAVSVRELQKQTEDILNQRTAMNIAQKKLIAEKAAPLMEAGHSTFIDSGSTSLFFVKQLPDLHYTVITNGINIALELSRNTMPQITLLGGNVSRNNFATSGTSTCEFLDQLNIDMAFLGTSAFTVDGGFTCGSSAEADIKKLIVQKAKRKIMLMDSSKCSKVMPYTFAEFSDIDVLITDSNLAQDVKDAALKLGIAIM